MVEILLFKKKNPEFFGSTGNINHSSFKLKRNLFNLREIIHAKEKLTLFSTEKLIHAS